MLLVCSVIASPVVFVAVPVHAQYTDSELYYRHQAEMREMQRQNWVDGWFQTSRAVMWEEANKRRALELCRKAPGGCHSRFTVEAGAPTGPALLAASFGGSAEAKQQATATATALLATYGQVAGALRLPRNDVAAPMAYCFLTAMLIYNATEPSLAAPLAQKVLTQTRSQLANDGGMALTNDTKRRERYEVLGIVGVYLNAEFRAATREQDAPRLTRLRRLAGAVVRELSAVAPEQLRVTATGVVASGAPAPAGTGRSPTVVLNATTTTRFAFDSGAMLNPRDRANLAS